MLRREFAPDTSIRHKGARVSGAYVVIEGRLRIYSLAVLLQRTVTQIKFAVSKSAPPVTATDGTALQTCFRIIQGNTGP